MRNLETSIDILLTVLSRYIPGMRLRVTDDVEEIGYDLDQFADEMVGEWGIYDTEEGHDRRRSSVMMGVPTAGPFGGGSDTPSDEPEKDRTEEGPRGEPTQ